MCNILRRGRKGKKSVVTNHLWNNDEPPSVKRVVYILPEREKNKIRFVIDIRQSHPTPIAFHFILSLYQTDSFLFWH